MSTSSNVVRLPRKRVRTRPYVRPARRSQRRQQWSAVTVALVAVVLTALSLSHLAHGIELVTRAPAWEAWSMAIGIDLGFVAARDRPALCRHREGANRDKPVDQTGNPRHDRRQRGDECARVRCPVRRLAPLSSRWPGARDPGPRLLPQPGGLRAGCFEVDPSCAPFGRRPEGAFLRP